MHRRKGLHHHFALHLAAARATGHLGEQLKGPFARTEVRQMQTGIRIHDADQGHARKVQAFGDHLGAHKDIDFATAKVAEDATVIIFALKRIRIHAGNIRARE